MAALGRPGYINLQRDAVIQSRTIDGMQNQANDVIDELFKYCNNGEGGEGSDSVPWLDCARSYGLSEKVSQILGHIIVAVDIHIILFSNLQFPTCHSSSRALFVLYYSNII